MKKGRLKPFFISLQINQSDEIREQLQELISLALEDDQEMETKQQEEQVTNVDQNGDCDDNVSREKKEAKEEDELVLKLEENPDTDESETLKEVLKKDGEFLVFCYIVDQCENRN